MTEDDAQPVSEGDVVVDSGTLSPAYFRGLVSEAEALIADRDEIAAQLRDLRKAANERGVNLKAFAELLKRRAMDSRARDDFDESLAIYERVAGLSRGVIEGGELKASTVPLLTGSSGSRGKALQEALAWAGVPSG